MTVPPPPLIPAAGETVIAAGLFLTWIVSFGMLWVYRATLSRVALALAATVEGVSVHTRLGTIHPFGAFADAIRWVDGEIDDGLAWAMKNSQRGATVLFHLVTKQLRAIGDQIGGLAYDLSHAIDRTITVTIPHAVGRVERRLGRDIRLVRTLARSTAATVAHDLPLLRREVADWRGYTRRLARRLRRAEKMLAPAAFAALVVGALARLGLGVLRCPRFLKAARRTCGMDPALLESMLLDTTLILGAISLVEFAHELQAVVEPVESGIRHLIREA
jgi:hypothetical protein